MNIELEVLEKDLVVILPSEAKAISTTVYGGGFKRNLKYVVFHEVSRDFNGNPIDECKSVLENLNLDLEKSAVFLTATKVSEKYVLTQGENENLKCTVVATVGLSNPISIPINQLYPSISTINILVVVSKGISNYGLVELIKTVADARASAIHDIDLRFKSKYAIGTSTDAFIVASLKHPPDELYGGPLTSIGSLVSKLVYRTVISGARKNGYAPDRSMIKRLRERGILLEDMIETALTLFIRWSNLTIEDAREFIREELIKCLNDVNVLSFIEAAFRLDEDARLGLIPGLTLQDYLSDPVHLVADEILALSLAMYLNGWNAVFELYRYDTKKPGILSKLPPFLDDIIAALIAGVTSRVYSKFMESVN